MEKKFKNIDEKIGRGIGKDIIRQITDRADKRIVSLLWIKIHDRVNAKVWQELWMNIGSKRS